MFFRHTVGIIFVVSLAISPPLYADSFTERWYLNRGRAYLEKRNYQAAVEAFDKVLTVNERNKDALDNKALAYLRAGLPAQAAEVYERYLSFYPNEAKVVFALAELLLASESADRRQEAVNYYARGLTLSKDPSLRIRYAELLSERAETRVQAAAEFERILELNPHSARAHAGAANVYAWLGQVDRAREHADQAYSYNRHLEGLDALRKRLAKHSPSDAALAAVDPLSDIEKAYDSDPADPTLTMKLAQAYTRRGRKSDAIAVYEKGVQNYRHPDLLFALAELYRDSNNPEQRIRAVPYYADGLTRQDNWTMRLHYAEILLESEEYKYQALAQYDLLLQKDPRSAEARFGRARALAAQDRWEEAYIEFQEARRKKTHLPGQAAFAKQLTSSGVAQLGSDRRAYEAHPNNSAAVIRLAKTYVRIGQSDRARVALDDFLRRYPENPDVLFAAAQEVESSPEHLQALTYYDRALDIRDDPAMRLQYAQLLDESPETRRDAAAEFETLLKTSPKNAAVHLGAARIYQRAGDPGRAFEHVRRAVQLDPNLVPAVQLYGELREGRETRLGAEMTFFNQTGEPYRLTGFTLGPRLDFFPKSSIVASAQAGVAHYAAHDVDGTGPEMTAGLKYMDPMGRSLEGSIGIMHLPDIKKPFKGLARYGEEHWNRWKWFGFQRDFIYDSYLSLLSARSNLYFGDFGRRFGPFSLGFRPFFGWIESAALESNPKIGGTGSVNYNVLTTSSSTLGIIYEVQITRYGQDYSLSGGYFSPKRFIEQIPQLAWKFQASALRFQIAAGPSIQYIRLQSDAEGTTRVGSQASFGGQYRFFGDWQANLQIEFKDIAAVYRRVGAGAVIQRLF